MQPSLHFKCKGPPEPFQAKSPVRHLQPVSQAFRPPQGSLSRLCERQESMNNLFVSQRYVSKSRPRMNEYPRQGVSAEPLRMEGTHPPLDTHHQQMNHQWFNRLLCPQSIQRGSCPEFDIKRSNTEILRQELLPKCEMTYQHNPYDPMNAVRHQLMRPCEKTSTASNQRMTTHVGTSDPSERKTTTSNHIMQSRRVPSQVRTFERLPPPTQDKNIDNGAAHNGNKNEVATYQRVESPSRGVAEGNDRKERVFGCI